MGDTSMYPRRDWVTREKQYVIDHAGLKHPADIGVALGRTETSVRHFAYKNKISLSVGTYTYWSDDENRRLLKFAREQRQTRYVKTLFPGHTEASTANRYRKICRALREGTGDMRCIKGGGVRGKHLEHTVRSINVRNNIDEAALYSLHVERKNNRTDGMKPVWTYRVVMVTKGLPITVVQWGTAGQCTDQLKNVKWAAVMTAARGVTR